VQRVVTTGLDAITPIGLTTEDFWRDLINGISGAGPIASFDASDPTTRIGAELGF